LFKKIVDLKVSDFGFWPVSSGKHAGRRSYELLGTNADKMKKLGLGSDTELRSNPKLFTIYEDPNDPEWSTFACFHRLISTHCPADYKSHIFCKRAPEKVLRERRKVGDPTEAHWDLVKNNEGLPKAAGKLGKNKPTEMFRSLAHRCAFANPDRFTARSARRTGITLMCKSGVNQHLINAKARHSDTATNALYCDPHSDEYAEAAVALHYKPAGKYIVVNSILDLLSTHFFNSMQPNLQWTIQKKIFRKTSIWS
jgi:hypothetical protein